MNEEELLQLYLLSMGIPGKNASQRYNLLQDFGFDPFKGGQQFQREQWTPEPEPYWVNPVEETYASDPNYKKLFEMIESGVAPDVAADQLIKANILKPKTINDPESMSDPFVVARMYKQREVENQAERDNWLRNQQTAEGKFMAEQDVAERKFREQQPYTFEDLRGQSAFEAAGQPTVDELMRISAEQRAAQQKQARGGRPAPVQGAGRRGSPSAAASVKQRRLPPVQKDFYSNPQYTKALRKELENRVTRSQQTYVPTQRSEEAMRTLALMQFLGQ